MSLHQDYISFIYLYLLSLFLLFTFTVLCSVRHWKSISTSRFLHYHFWGSVLDTKFSGTIMAFSASDGYFQEKGLSTWSLVLSQYSMGLDVRLEVSMSLKCGHLFTLFFFILSVTGTQGNKVKFYCKMYRRGQNFWFKFVNGWFLLNCALVL